MFSIEMTDPIINYKDVRRSYLCRLTSMTMICGVSNVGAVGDVLHLIKWKGCAALIKF